MHLIIDLSPSEEAQLAAAANQNGLNPAEIVKRWVKEHLPVTPVIAHADLDAKLRKWQEQDGAVLMPDVSTQALFAQWAEEDGQMTDEEREVEDRLWADLENRTIENRGGLQLRRLSEW